MSTNTCSQTREKYLRSREREERQREQDKRTGERKRKEEKTHECTEEDLSMIEQMHEKLGNPKIQYL